MNLYRNGLGTVFRHLPNFFKIIVHAVYKNIMFDECSAVAVTPQCFDNTVF